MSWASRRSRKGLGKRWGIPFIFSIIALLATWMLGLTWFVSKVPARHIENRTKTDAIIVLTGGTGRLEAGLQLLADGYAKLLFVSGVARGVDVQALLKLVRRKPDDFACCIAVGYRADSTAGNAIETTQWIKKNKLSSLRLVTASYHMPRSLYEFRKVMPSIKIVPHSVFPPQFKRNGWWRWPGTARLLAIEFNKYLIAKIGIGPDMKRLWDSKP
ncbi:MAG: YdcF family protein [Alphaproteobacteria bacterium]|nr:YdcF family protein [Alphaproteobacteria bacterium]